MSKKHKKKGKALKNFIKVKIVFNTLITKVFNAIGFLKNILRGITWPTKKEVLLYSIAVFIISVIITAYLVSLDAIFNYIRLITLFK